MRLQLLLRLLKAETGTCITLGYIVRSCVADPSHFGTDPDLYLSLTDPDSGPDLAIFVSDLQDGT
jgi:hypothetical protein